MKRNLWLVLILTFVCIITLSACDTTDTPQNDAHIHTYGEWKTTSEANCTEGGSKVRVCECGEKETETISALGHNYKSVTIDPTASTDGYKEHTCSVCGDTYKDSYVTPIAFTITENNRGLIGYKGTENEELVIPTVFQNAKKWYKVTEIADYAFDGCDNLRNVTIPDTVTSIGAYAFAYCENLNSVFLPNGITTIKESTFEYCLNLVSITIPESVSTIEDHAFLNCIKLIEVINHSPLNITTSSSNNYALYNLMEVHKGESKIVNKDDYLFYTYRGVNYLVGYIGTDTNLVLPNDYNGENYKIFELAFVACKALKSITIPDSVTEIGDSAFEGCSNLTSIVIPNSITCIGDGTFYWCENLTNVTIPDSVTSIGYGAFLGCSQLTSITIPNSVTSIGRDAFSECTRLTSLHINDNIRKIENGTFAGCTSLSSVTIPNSVTEIDDNAFRGCTNLTSITIPNSVTRIGEYAFFKCNKLSNIKFDGTIDEWNAITKGYNWDSYTPKYVVECIDGTI